MERVGTHGIKSGRTITNQVSNICWCCSCVSFFSHRQTIGKIWKNHLLRQGTWLALKLCPWRTCPSWIFAAAVARRTMLRWKMPRAMTLKKATYAIEMWRLKNHCIYFRIIGVAEAFRDICFSSFIYICFRLWLCWRPGPNKMLMPRGRTMFQMSQDIDLHAPWAKTRQMSLISPWPSLQLLRSEAKVSPLKSVRPPHALEEARTKTKSWQGSSFQFPEPIRRWLYWLVNVPTMDYHTPQYQK